LGGGRALLAVRPRVPTRIVTGAVLVGAVALDAGTAAAPAPVALASAALVVLVAIEAVMFLDRRFAWSLIAFAAACQVVPLMAVHGVSVAVVGAYALLWAGVARAVDVLVRQASAAGVDALTGLADRRAWDAALERAIDRRGRRGAPLSLALVDIDHFKRVNLR